ncbi:MAG: hypothetical protein U9Q98_12215 [Bacteroidota bacterium]|nr:hypothetical protein [Bacteroidota bacterium]
MKAQSYCKQTTYSIPTSSYPFYAEKPILTLNSPKGNNGTAIPFAIFNMFVEKTRQFN